MKKIFSTCLMAMAMATMSAQDVPFTVSPASGSTVQSITSTNPILLDFPQGSKFSILEINSRDDIYFTYNGVKCCGILRAGYDLPLEIKPEDDLTSPGEYQLVIEPGAIGWMTADPQSMDDLGDNEEQLVYTYTIEGNATSDGVLYSANPEENTPVSEIYGIYIANTTNYLLQAVNGQTDYYADPYDICITLNGEKAYNVEIEMDPDGTGFNVYILDENNEYVTISKAGTYQLVIGEYQFMLVNPADENDLTPIAEETVFTYIVEVPEIDYSSLPFDIYPAVGTPVATLSQITLEPNQELGYSSIVCEDSYNWYLSDSEGNTIQFSLLEDENDAYIQVIPNEPITTSGTYTLTISPYSLIVTGNGRYRNDQTISLPFNVIGAVANPYDVPFEIAYPSAAEIEGWENFELDILPDSGYTSFVVKNPNGIYYTKDGKFYSKVNVDGWGNEWYFDTVISVTSSGEYALVIEEDALGWTNEAETETVYNKEKMVFNVTVVIDNEPEVAPFTIDPADDATVESLSTITFTFDSKYTQTSLTADYFFFTDPDHNYLDFEITKDAADENIHTLTLKKEATAAGTYTLAINPRGVTYYEDGTRIRNSQALIYTFNVAAKVEPVVYDVVPTDYSPSDGTVIDFNSRDLATIIIYTGTDIAPSETATAYLIPVDDPDDVAVAAIKKNRMAGQLIIDFTAREYNGEYTLLIPQGSFGDEAWLANPETGHANPEITLTYTLINAQDRASKVEYTLEPEVTVSDDYSTFTLKFNENVSMVRYASAFFECIEARYSVFGMFTDNGDNTFTVVFTEAPHEAGTYTFIVEQGLFGNEEYIESNNYAGVANKEITLQYEITESGIKTVVATPAAEGVYNLMGVKVADTTENLPAGIYIVNGKKVVLK